MTESNCEISTLANKISLWPSNSVALKADSKKNISSFDNLQIYLKQIKDEHGDRVRVLVRYSGTEPMIRILVEAEDKKIMEVVFSRVKALVAEHI